MTNALTANEKLILCCHGDPEIDKDCAEKYCQIPSIAPHMVVPFISECAPKGRTVPRVWDCLSSRHDHTECCKRQERQLPSSSSRVPDTVVPKVSYTSNVKQTSLAVGRLLA
ncbi:unnamed protein product [Strongylus vulgaris]|uniref:Domain of unknown function DB domain-containing protein n=1 Tax=Strongylus vulgaris TaxID=40348 RepID=A0A3P7JSK4_STRVU|nr:unnamed protein product [Strongylus vulgaris]